MNRRGFIRNLAGLGASIAVSPYVELALRRFKPGRKLVKQCVIDEPNYKAFIFPLSGAVFCWTGIQSRGIVHKNTATMGRRCRDFAVKEFYG